MKYKLTKQAWEEIGREAGWMGLPEDVALEVDYRAGPKVVTCPKCGEKAELTRDKWGAKGECPSCGHKWRIR